MLKIGLTGGLGSGKSTVAGIFEVLGIPVYYADDASKRLMNENIRVKGQIIDAFGPGAYTEEKLNRKYLAEIVFKDEKKLTVLNAIVHPATLQDVKEWMSEQTSPYVIKEAALIFESGSEKQLDHVIGIKTPLELRLQRAIKRDNITEEQAMARINKQMNEEEKIALCDFVIKNDEKEGLLQQVFRIHESLLAKGLMVDGL